MFLMYFTHGSPTKDIKRLYIIIYGTSLSIIQEFDDSALGAGWT